MTDARAALVERAKTLFSEWHSGAFPTIPAAPWEIIGEVAQTGWIYAAEQEHRREQAAMERMRDAAANEVRSRANVHKEDVERQRKAGRFALAQETEGKWEMLTRSEQAIRRMPLPDATGEG